MTKLAEIEGIGPAYAEKLQAAGVRSVQKLNKLGATPQGRRALAEKAGFADSTILEWVNHADLFRIKGIAGEYAELLEAAGVDTVPELAQRNAAHLTQKLAEVNEARHLVRKLPAETLVADWIKQAKRLPRVVKY